MQEETTAAASGEGPPGLVGTGRAEGGSRVSAGSSQTQSCRMELGQSREPGRAQALAGGQVLGTG